MLSVLFVVDRGGGASLEVPLRPLAAPPAPSDCSVLDPRPAPPGVWDNAYEGGGAGAGPRHACARPPAQTDRHLRRVNHLPQPPPFQLREDAARKPRYTSRKVSRLRPWLHSRRPNPHSLYPCSGGHPLPSAPLGPLTLRTPPRRTGPTLAGEPDLRALRPWETVESGPGVPRRGPVGPQEAPPSWPASTSFRKKPSERRTGLAILYAPERRVLNTRFLGSV